MMTAPQKLDIGILGENRHPVLPDGAGGLGRSTYDLAAGLAHRGHAVTLYAKRGSRFEFGRLLPLGSGVCQGDHDVCIDYSHSHDAFGSEAVLHLIGDRECPGTPPNGVVATRSMQMNYPQARLVKYGLDIASIPFYPRSAGYLVFVGSKAEHKQPLTAARVAALAGLRIHFIGHRCLWRRYCHGELSGKPKWDLFGQALGLISPFTIDAAPRVPLEAAALGVPTICLDADGTREHVKHGVSGLVCRDLHAMVAAVDTLASISRQGCRQWVESVHPAERMLDEYERLLWQIAAGVRW